MTLSRNAQTIITSSTPARYPFVPWERLKPAIRWRQGQHWITVGGTESGKSTVAGEFLPRRRRKVVMVSKGYDPIFDGPYYRDYERIRSWPPPRQSLTEVLLWPRNTKDLRTTAVHKAAVFRNMFNRVLLREGYWCICVDETHYSCATLRLAPEITDIMEQGRSFGISMWNNTQRPSGIPLSIYVNSQHASLFSSQEQVDVERLRTLANKHTTQKELQANLGNIDSFETHEHIYIDRTGRIPPVRTIVKLKKG